MRILCIDQEGMMLDFVLRCTAADHDVRWYRHGKETRDGEGFKGFKVLDEWAPSMPWAKEGLIICSGNFVHLAELDRYRDLGYKIFAPTVKSAELEIKRSAGMEAMKAAGIEVPPYHEFKSLEDAEKFARKSDQCWVFKTMGSEADKSLSFVSCDPAEMVGWIRQKIERGMVLKGPCMLQEKIDMLAEVGVSGWFGPDGFLPDKWQECWEHKCLMNGEIGPNTGEQGCYSYDTEVLTSRGWKFWPDVTKHDELATLSDGKLKFELPSAVVSYDVDGPMVKWANRSIDIFVTPNHNMYVCGQGPARDGIPKFKFIQASKCTQSQYLLKRTADWTGRSPENYVVSGNQWHTGMGSRSTKDTCIPFRDWCRFLGIYFAEGSPTTGGINIAQSTARKCELVAKILASLPYKIKRVRHGFVINNRSLSRLLKPFGRSYQKRVPDYILNARPEDILAFLDGFAVGDAHTQANGSRVFYTSNPGLADDLQELMLRCGSLGIIKKLKPKTPGATIDGRLIVQRRPAYVVYERARKITGWLDSRDRQEVHYTGKVYCATVTSHILFVRRNGKPVWCGNTVCQYVEQSKIADIALKPMESILKVLGHRGDFALGAGIDTKGNVWPFEWTARCGWPAFWIQTASHKDDPAQWMRDLLDGEDTLRVSRETAIGVVLAQPMYPYAKSTPEMVEGNPISGCEDVIDDLHFASVMMGKGPKWEDGKIVERPIYQTTGEYVMVATGLGKTVEKARKAVYDVVDQVKFPGRMYRTDIGEKLERPLDKLHALGFCKETVYS